MSSYATRTEQVEALADAHLKLCNKVGLLVARVEQLEAQVSQQHLVQFTATAETLSGVCALSGAQNSCSSSKSMGKGKGTGNAGKGKALAFEDLLVRDSFSSPVTVKVTGAAPAAAAAAAATEKAEEEEDPWSTFFGVEFTGELPNFV